LPRRSVGDFAETQNLCKVGTMIEQLDPIQIINAIPALAWTARADGSAEFFNQHYLDYTGLPAEQAEGWGWTAAVHPEDLNGLAGTWQVIMASKKLGEAEARLRRFDGQYRWFLFRANPLLDEARNVIKWYGVNTDIDDRKRAEEELRRSEAFLAQAQRLSSTGSFSWRVATDEIAWSEQLYRIFAIEPGVPVTFELMATRVHAEDIALFREEIDQARRDGRDFAYEQRLSMPDGSVKFVHFVAQGARDRNGRLEYIGAVQDVTERRRSEEALSKSRSELAHVARVSSLGTLTASIAHEVNQPLAGIVNNASTCLLMLGGDSPNIEGARETARRMVRDSNRASDVIARLRALFGKKEARIEPVNLNDAVHEVIALSASEIQRARAVLQLERAADLPDVAGDRVQLQQVILNLLLNALDAMGGVNDGPRRLLIRTERDGADRVRMTVKDVGVGFEPGGAERLFEAFYTTKSNGMGMGLSVSRSIIERHHGRLWAAPSDDGPGAMFSFSIPKNTTV
jgi:PAS domain S-box-containing protein